ncbi:nitrate ABC transporter permease [Actinomadura cremea]|nr:nitrate ABC transporter permease [Actinomadura cremea]
MKRPRASAPSLLTGRGTAGLLAEILVPAAIVAAIAVWSAGAGAFYFPPLTDILRTFADTWLFDRFGSDVLPSLGRMAAGYLIAAVVGVTAGCLLALIPLAARLAEPIVEFLRAVPPPVLLPFGILVFGTGDQMKIFVIALTCTFPILLTTVEGVRGIDRTTLEMARMYGLTGTARFKRLVLPAASPHIFAGLRTSLSLALILMVISELVASTDGIGFFVVQAQRTFAIPEMWSGIILLGVLGYLLNALLSLVERRVLRWHRAMGETRR